VNILTERKERRERERERERVMLPHEMAINSQSAFDGVTPVISKFFQRNFIEAEQIKRTPFRQVFLFVRI